MALTFKGTGEDDEEEEEEVKKEYDSGVSVDDEDKIFRTRGFKGNVKASLNRAPRTLSSSSLRTRKRMEALMRRAREFMKKDKSAKKSSSAANATKNTTAPTKNTTAPTNTTTVDTPTPVTVVNPTTVVVPTPETIVEDDSNKITETIEDKPKENGNCDTKPKENGNHDNKSTEKEIIDEPKLDDKNNENKNPIEQVAEPLVEEEDLHLELEDDEELEDEEVDFDGISDGDEDDDDNDGDGLLIPLENGWVCEKRLVDMESNSYSTHFWSPCGQRHSSLSSIKSYGTKKKLKLNMIIFEKALKTNPHK